MKIAAEGIVRQDEFGKHIFCRKYRLDFYFSNQLENKVNKGDKFKITLERLAFRGNR